MESTEVRAPRRRKRISKPRFLLLIALCVGLSALKSTFGGSVARRTSAGEADEKTDGKGPEYTVEETGETLASTWATTLAKDEPRHSKTTESTPGDEKGGGSEANASSAKKEDQYACPSGRYPAVEQFPKPWMSQNVRIHGGIILYIVVTAYTFLAVAIVCDEFFVPSLEILVEVLKISPDVAGATFMAAGSSAPELATALIGVFIAHDDIGVSGVIGSAVFNIMFVISLCALLTPRVLYLNWWPLVRDCFFYMVSILALLGTIEDETIQWYESIILLLLYGVYCYVMYMNEILEAWAHTLPIPLPVHVPQISNTEKQQMDEKSHLVTFKAASVSDDPARIEGLDGSRNRGDEVMAEGEGIDSSGNRISSSVTGSSGAGKVPGPAVESIVSKLEPPSEGGWRKILWQVSLPLIYMLYYTVPDCRLEKWRSWYLVTFTLAMVWIAIFSYFMVWMITVIGFTVGIPDTVMGLTFVAAGVSVPDALSSLAVIKEGYGDMAVSNAVGSNVFDILICLGLPWFLSTVIVHPGVPVIVRSKGLVYSTLSLLSTVAFLLIATHYNGWKLDRKYGIILMVWYLIFMTFASLYELNVFGPFNPPECGSAY